MNLRTFLAIPSLPPSLTPARIPISDRWWHALWPLSALVSRARIGNYRARSRHNDVCNESERMSKMVSFIIDRNYYYYPQIENIIRWISYWINIPECSWSIPSCGNDSSLLLPIIPSASTTSRASSASSSFDMHPGVTRCIFAALLKSTNLWLIHISEMQPWGERKKERGNCSRDWLNELSTYHYLSNFIEIGKISWLYNLEDFDLESCLIRGKIYRGNQSKIKRFQ